MSDAVLRVGLFGLLGAGNLGNDGSLEAVLAWLRADHPEAEVSFLCSGPEQVTARYGFPATRLHWNRGEYHTAEGLPDLVAKVLGKAVDGVRFARWVGQRDVVVVPGMGVLEATLPLRPWGFPYSLLLLTAAGRLRRTQVALVSVGANTDGSRWTRRVFTLAARLASYRSYRDELSRDAMRQSGLDVRADAVYPDLVFALPDPPAASTSPGTVGLGVMHYHGTDDERARADEIAAAYVAKVKQFGRWLLDGGHHVRLFTGDRADEVVADEVAADLRAHRPDLDASWVVFEPPATLDELMAQMSAVDIVVATRYHNVLCALKLSKPTISVGYAAKNDVLMQEMGVAEFCQPVATLDVDLLKEQLTKLVDRKDQLRDAMLQQNAANLRDARRQLDLLSATLLRPRRTSGDDRRKDL